MNAPQLAIVVDTEEEFDWDAPFSRDNRSTKSITAQTQAHEFYDRFGIVPTYVVSHPVATDPAAVRFLSDLQSARRAEIGAHLHPWVCPPFEEDVNDHNSFQCNLPPALEHAKIAQLTEVITQNFGQRPLVFKAGRYGFGENTRQSLIALGYKIDCSTVPHIGYARKGGPNYYGVPDQPFWLDEGKALLEIPLTTGFAGALRRFGSNLAPLYESPLAVQAHVPGVLARTGLLVRSQLTPEGITANEQINLLKTLVQQGKNIFTLAYHSPSLASGNTPYVRSEPDLSTFLTTIEQVLTYFRDELGGTFTTLSRIRQDYALKD